MNIIFLDTSPSWVARYHCDRRLEKQILEVAQCLQSAHVACDGSPRAYRRVGRAVTVTRIQIGSSSSRWVRETSCNYQWAHALFRQLIVEYELRTRRVHSMHDLSNVFMARPLLLPHDEMTEFPVNMIPESFHQENAVAAHRAAYFAHSRHLAQWTDPATVPHWWKALEAGPRRAA